MVSSSRRVRLNRVSLRDVIRQKLVPRRRPAPKTADPHNEEETPPSNGQTVWSEPRAQGGTCAGSTCAGPWQEDRKGPELRPLHGDADRATHPSLGSPDSEGSLRRSFRASCCSLCGQLKYISPQQKTRDKLRRKSRDPGPEKPIIKFKLLERNIDPETSQKVVVWINQYPKVVLYDIAQKCDPGMRDGQDLKPEDLYRRPSLCRDSRIRVGDHRENEAFPSTPDLESFCKNQTSDPRMKEREHLLESTDSQSCSECVGRVGNCSSLVPHVTENKIYKKPSEMKSFTNGGVEVFELFSQSSEVDRYEPESLTCQRVRVYSRRTLSSCARAYLSWPFSKSSRTPTAHPGTRSQPAEHTKLLSKDNNASSVNQDQSGLLNKNTSDVIPDLPQQSEKKKEDEEKDTWFGPGLIEAEESQASLSSETLCLSIPHQSALVSPSSSGVSGPKTDSTVSTPSPTALGLSNWNTACTLPSTSSPSSTDGCRGLSDTLSSPPPPSVGVEAHSDSRSAASPSATFVVRSLEKQLLYSEETLMTTCASSDSSASTESSFLLTQETDGEAFTDSVPPTLEPFYCTRPGSHNRMFLNVRTLDQTPTENCREIYSGEFLLPPVLSPFTSPIRHMSKVLVPQDPDSSGGEEMEERRSEEPGERQKFVGCRIIHINKGNDEDFEDHLEDGVRENEGVSTYSTTSSLLRSGPSPCIDKDSDSGDDEEECQSETDNEEDVEQANEKPDQVYSDTKTEAAPGLVSCSKSSSSLRIDEDEADCDEEKLCPSSEESSSSGEASDVERDQVSAEPAIESCGTLDEFSAYEQDILLVDMIQDDPELFGNLPQKSILRLGPARVTEAPQSRPAGVVKTQFPKRDGSSASLEKRLAPVKFNLCCDSPDNTDECSRSWRPQSNADTKQSVSRSKPKASVQSDANNNHVNGELERIQLLKPLTSQPNAISARISIKNGPRSTNSTNSAELRLQQTQYCRQYFSESLCCGYKMCWFLHVPVDGDEKFCIDTVTRFTKNPACLQRAGAVFTGYYRSNPPGRHFSMPVLLSLLWALLRAGMVSEVFSILSVSLIHKRVPGHEFLLALFNYVREKSLHGLVPELMQLTFKMASAGLVLSLDCLDSVKNTPEVKQTGSHALVTGSNRISSSARFPEYLNLAHSIVEIELCTKQEDWRRMGEVFRSVCQSSRHPSQVERISGRITIALLSESKDKQSLPFTVFAETACSNKEEETLNRSFLGRIGVSLMLRYHKTHQWAKGRRVVEVLTNSKVNYSTLKGLFGNEDGTSRCYLVTVATELLLLSGSVEGALNTLRENKWFLSSSEWPCESSDLESRTRVLIRLAEKSSHRDSLDILKHLPGLKEPNNMDISVYCPLFNSHLQVCLDRSTLSVASATVDFMFSRNLAVDQAMLHTLLNKLGKQNLWLRAREVFRHSLNVGYYPGVSAPPGFMSLMVPCRLGEVELALTLEMFITVNASVLLHLSENSTCHLNITLKRTQNCESEYLNASNRLASAACIPYPKLDILYTGVNASQEQVYTLDISSARAWLRQNHLWASEVWTH